MTEQDVRRLEAVAQLYAEVDPAGAARLREAVARAKVMPAAKVPRSTVTMNSRIVRRDDAGRELELSLVYPWDADGARISVLSEDGCALLGAAVGATLELDGSSVKVSSIPYQPEAAGDHHL